MRVMKFGGTSVGTPERLKFVTELITNDAEKKIVVLSAFSGTTNALEEISKFLSLNEREEARNAISQLEKKYIAYTAELFQTPGGSQAGKSILQEHMEFLRIAGKISYSEALRKDILAQGELLSTKLFCAYLSEQAIEHKLLPALDFMKMDKHQEPLIGTIRVNLSQIMDKYPHINLFVTQGYITRNFRGEVDNLRRGGSDFSASVIAAAMKASRCEIWTDIDGMHNNDPRIVDKTTPVKALHFDEAAELAYFGAKILHPASIWPAQQYDIPVILKNTLDPNAEGTTISSQETSHGLKAVAAKDNITAIRIKSSRMLMAYGFLRKVFEIFERNETSIDMITTSEVAISLTIDDNTNLPDILKELEKYGTVEVDENQTIISVVGNHIDESHHLLANLFEALSDIPVRMISFGGSKNNISLLVQSADKAATLQAINKQLFNL